MVYVSRLWHVKTATDRHCAKKNRYSKTAIQKCQIAIQKSDVATQISTDPYKHTEKHREKVTKLPLAPCPSNPLGSAKTDQLEQLNSGGSGSV